MPESRMLDHLTFLYGQERAIHVLKQLQELLNQFKSSVQMTREPRLCERDVILITYGDQVQEAGQPPLQTLAEILEIYVQNSISGLHILPFFPYSSDDGFSVVDYTAVNPDLGTWMDIERLHQHYRLMFDAVVNHVSAQSQWFQEFRRGNPDYADYFITVQEDTDLSMVIRPRALPLLTRIQTRQGEQFVWTTFSTDQIDLNFAHPEVLLRMIQILLFYVERGAEIIRLDAIAYLWKKIGTSCIHLEETHRVVKLFRAVLETVAPHVMIITETNVPHQENISYFGDGTDEAHMVYQFVLPPLVLHTFLSGDASQLAHWAAGLSTPSPQTAFYNFLASHDGIGVRPVEGILSPQDMQNLVDRTLAHGGYVSYKTNSDGSQSVYELNISYFDALSNPQAAESLELQVRRFLASQAVLLSLAGLPAIYAHSLFGSRSDRASVERGGPYRSINRAKFQRQRLERELTDPRSLRHRIFYPYLHLIRTRTSQPAFHPNAPQRILSQNPRVFALVRGPFQKHPAILCLHNVTPSKQTFHIHPRELDCPPCRSIYDLITGATYPVDGSGRIRLHLSPYQVYWLTGTG